MNQQTLATPKSGAIVFDAGPVISLSLNNLLGILRPLKERFGGRFLISRGVLNELVTRPLQIRRFEFEALQVIELIKQGIIEPVKEDDGLKQLASSLMSSANGSFWCSGKNINLVHYGEMSSLALAVRENAVAYVVDERTTRLLMESPVDLQSILGKKLHMPITLKKDALNFFSEHANTNVMRSSELVIVAYKLGLLDKYIPGREYAVNPRKTLLNSVLWAIKINGCAISSKEIEQVVRKEA